MQGNEYIALDITSISSYSQLLESSEWGYRLNGKRIVQPISKEQHEIFKALGFKDPVG